MAPLGRPEGHRPVAGALITLQDCASEQTPARATIVSRRGRPVTGWLPAGPFCANVLYRRALSHVASSSTYARTMPAPPDHGASAWPAELITPMPGRQAGATQRSINSRD